MQQAPDRRYQSTQEMRADVAMALTPVKSAPAPKRRGTTSQPLPMVEPPRGRSPVFTAAFVLVVGVLGYLIHGKWKPSSPVGGATPEIARTAPGAASTSPPIADNPGPPTLDPPASAAALEAPATAPTVAMRTPTTEARASTPAAPSPGVPAPAPAAPLSATGKWLAEQEPVWQAAYASEVSGPFEKGAADLKKQYLAALENQIATSARAAKLDDAVAFRAERDRMTGGGDVPAEDETTTPTALRTLRTNYRTAFTKLDTDRFTKAQAVHARYVAILTQSQTALTQKQRFDEALEMKAKREALSAAWLVPPAGGISAAPTPTSGAAQGVRAPLSPAILRDGFTNILGMKFVPVRGTDVLFCVHETRRQDYAAYAGQVADVDGRWQNEKRDGIPIGGENIHPVVAVSWDDAQAFCAWLSRMDGKTYRLPTDEEWSIAVGLGRLERRSKDTTPEMLTEKETTEYPWDGSFPPRTRDRAGNYADKAYHEKFPAERWNEGYSDGFATTAPVMSFKPSKAGLYDMGGNVREWVDDWWNASQQERTLRGSDWNASGLAKYFLASYRYKYASSTRSPTLGFRAVVENRLPAKPASVITKATATPANKPAAAKEAGVWEDLVAPLTPAEVEKTGNGWSLKDGELFSPDTKFAALPLPGEASGTSYTVRVKLRQLPAKNVFHLVLPVADRMCGFELEGRPHGSIHTGLSLVNGKLGKDIPGVVEGKLVNDTEPHELEVTVRLDGTNATITTTLDTGPLYTWTGPTAALSQISGWAAATKPGTLALGTYAGGWAVSEVKLRRGDAASALARPAPATTPTAAVPRIAPPVNTFGPWQPFLTEAEWQQKGPGKREHVDGCVHLVNGKVEKAQPAADGAIRARMQYRTGSHGLGFNVRITEVGRYKLSVGDRGLELVHISGSAPSSSANTQVLGKYNLPKPLQPGDTLQLELRLQGDRLTALVDGAVAIEARDARAPGPGQWSITASDGWFESVEVQTPPLAAPAPAPPPGPDGWQDLLAALTPDFVGKTGSAWRLEGGALLSPDQVSALALLGDLAGTSYQVRVKLKRLSDGESFSVFLPVGDKLVGAALDGWPSQGCYSGLNLVDGKDARTLPGSAQGQQIKDSAPHDFELTVRLAGANATITATLDARPLFAWTGPTAVLSVSSKWSGAPPRSLALGTHVANWSVSEVKVKRLAAGK